MDVSRITEGEVRRALACLRRAESLDGSALLDMASLRARLATEGLAVTAEALEWALCALLCEVVRDRLSRRRALAAGTSVAPDDPDGTTALGADFAHGDVILEAWSALYHRYVCTAGTRATDLAALALPGVAHADRRFRRRVAEGVAALTRELRRSERSAEVPEPARHNLPHPMTRFVGRVKETGEVRALLGAHRLVTLTGPGGIGKTRLALEVARGLGAAHPHGVWWVGLSGVGEPTQVSRSVAVALHVRDQARQVSDAALAAYLSNKELLLVLDNCEHLRAACAAFARMVLERCPGIRVLATSRERLRVEGEAVWTVPPLPVPVGDGSAEPSVALCADAVRLFVDRAAAAGARFEVRAEEVDDIVTICRRLDGLPLAIEMAAARVTLLAPSELVERLTDRLDYQHAGRQTTAHHSTLRAVLDWSHGLLPAPEAVLLRRLSVFRGGWTLDAAEGVCGGEPLTSETTAGHLADLVEKSLVAPVLRGREQRWDLLETVLQYASERLAASGEEPALRRAHLHYFAETAAGASDEMTGPQQAEWLTRLEDDHANLSAALAWSRDGGDVVTGIRLAGSLLRFWLDHGHWHEGRDVLAGLTHDPVAAETGAHLARALDVQGVLERHLGDYKAARALHEEALRMFRRLGDETGVAIAACRLGNVADAQGLPEEARSCYEESLVIHRRLEHAAAVADVLGNLGALAYDRGDYAAADELLAESLATHRELGNAEGVARQLNWLASVAKARGEFCRARRLWEESLTGFRSLDDKWCMAVAMANLGDIAREEGDLSRAESLFEESLATFREVGNQACVAVTTMNLGAVARARGDLATAGERYRECLRLQRAIGERLYLSFALDECAKLAVAEGAAERAARLAGAAEAVRMSLGAAQPPDLAEELERHLAPVRAALGEAAFAASWAAGRGMALDDAVDLALQGVPAHEALAGGQDGG